MTREGTAAWVQRKEDNKEIHHSGRTDFITPDGHPVKREEERWRETLNAAHVTFV